jgi:hypothetical protein
VTHGKKNRLRKQADFLRVIQPFDWNLWFIPKWMHREANPLGNAQKPIYVYPGDQKKNEHLPLPKCIVDAIIARAEKQRKTEEMYTIRNVFKKMDEIVTCLNKHSAGLGDFSSGKWDRYLLRKTKKKKTFNEAHETSGYECGSFTARKLDDIELKLNVIKELIQLLPQEFSVKVQ